MKARKAQGLSMQTIVIASISVFVLVVVIVIFSGQMGRIFKGGVNPLVDDIGERACAARYALNSDQTKLKSCCEDLYKDVQNSGVLISGCQDNAKKKENS